MTRDDIEAVIAKVPQLTDFGVGIFDYGDTKTQAENKKLIAAALL